MEIEWRTVKFFMDEETLGISEVSVATLNPKKVKCDCPTFMRFGRCKHRSFVRDMLKNNGGVFDLTIPEHVDDETQEQAYRDPELFRELVLLFGKVEIL